MDSLTRTELSGREVGKAFLGRGFLKRPPGMKMGGVPDPTRVQHTEHKGKLLSTEFKVEHSPVLAEMVECRTSAASNFVFEGEVGIKSKRLLSVPPHSCPLSSPVIENESSEPLFRENMSPASQLACHTLCFQAAMGDNQSQGGACHWCGHTDASL